MGAVKEQSANLYAAKMAEQGFITLSLELSFWGESEGQPRNLVSPYIYAEDFSAAVDFLGAQPLVDKQRIGVIGICGSGSFVWGHSIFGYDRYPSIPLLGCQLGWVAG